MLVRSMRRDMNRTPAGRGGDVRFTPATPGIGASGCPGDNIVADWDAAMAALDAARHKSEDYELRAKAAEATLARIQKFVEGSGSARAWDDFDDGRSACARAVINIINGAK
jgi:hypothetical protein